MTLNSIIFHTATFQQHKTFIKTVPISDCRQAAVLTFGVGQEAVERREVAWARGDSEGVVLSEAVSRGST